MTPEELDQLKREVEVIESWRLQREQQQVTFPVDVESQGVLTKDLLVPTGGEVRPTGLLGTPFYSLEVDLNGTIYWLGASGKS